MKLSTTTCRQQRIDPSVKLRNLFVEPRKIRRRSPLFEASQGRIWIWQRTSHRYSMSWYWPVPLVQSCSTVTRLRSRWIWICAFLMMQCPDINPSQVARIIIVAPMIQFQFSTFNQVHWVYVQRSKYLYFLTLNGPCCPAHDDTCSPLYTSHGFLRE